MLKILSVIGARPQFIKASMISMELHKHGIPAVLVHTGQHFDANMSDIFFQQMQIPKPKYTLGISGGTHGSMTGRMLEKIEEVILLEKPELVLVYGDTNSTLAGALAAKKLNIKVAHIEAGLRSFNMQMPEEINRILTDRISNYLFCPTQQALYNLANEGFNNFECKIELVGDVMYDCFLHFSTSQKQPMNIAFQKEFVLSTIHRAENTDNVESLINIVLFLNELNQQYQVVLPLHPRTKAKICTLGLNTEFTVVDPVGYLEMLWLLNNAKFVVTDSGGLQKEAYFAKKTCITLRGETEWVELVEHGWNRLYDPKNKIRVSSNDLSLPDTDYLLYGNGAASSLIVKKLIE
jgi:UDP-GlcNAc3NAcA epimerase